jgi:tRNA pseudouridine38-40 synthase
MPRYFLEVCYKGTNYSGFQVQENANSIQAEVEKALNIFLRTGEAPIQLTGSSRTDAGVHALQNFFHFDSPLAILQKQVYNINSLLPADIAVKHIYPVQPGAHCRFDAISRQYKYFVYQKKSPLLFGRAYYYPYKPDTKRLNELANLILGEHNFSAFSKRNTQVKTFTCNITQSAWQREGECLVYTVTGNRFLRGMVRGLVGTMLKVTKKDEYVEAFKQIIDEGDCNKADFSAPGHGLFLIAVNYGEGVIPHVS